MPTDSTPFTRIEGIAILVLPRFRIARSFAALHRRERCVIRTVLAEPEMVVLVDEKNRRTGTASKLAVHHSETPLHRGFSCYVFNRDAQVLVTRRSPHKRTFPGVWTNSVCGHPGPGERATAAVRRRLQYELGLKARKIWCVLPEFRYRAEMDGVVEHELCPVYTGRSHAVDASLRVRLARGGRDDVEVRGCVIEEAPGTV